MIIIHNYHVPVDSDGMEKCVSCERESKCPVCDEILLCRDRRVRKYWDVDGKRHMMWIRRMKCSICNKLHNELPDFVVPYKQHVSVTIEKAVEEGLAKKEIMSECIPDVKTTKRWRIWVEKNILKINSHKDEISKENQYIQKYSIKIPLILKEITLKGKGWLSAILDLLLLNHFTYLSLP